MLNQWQRQIVYAVEGSLEIGNNLFENAIRPVAVGRKNYLFACSPEGAARAAIIYTFVAHANFNIEPFTYLRDFLARISVYPFKHQDDLFFSQYTHIREQELLHSI